VPYSIDPDGRRSEQSVAAAWRQVQAASLPNDERVLPGYAGYGRNLQG
jgi:hypothetical protein